MPRKNGKKVTVIPLIGQEPRPRVPESHLWDQLLQKARANVSKSYKIGAAEEAKTRMEWRNLVLGQLAQKNPDEFKYSNYDLFLAAIKDCRNKDKLIVLLDDFVASYAQTRIMMGTCSNNGFLGLHGFLQPTEIAERDEFIAKFNQLLNGF